MYSINSIKDKDFRLLGCCACSLVDINQRFGGQTASVIRAIKDSFCGTGYKRLLCINCINLGICGMVWYDLFFIKSCACTNENVQCYFRPLLKLVDCLLMVGMLTDEDVVKLLIMIDPGTWDESFQKGNFCMCIIIWDKSWKERAFKY
jgi:hypothetical protein